MSGFLLLATSSSVNYQIKRPNKNVGVKKQVMDGATIRSGLSSSASGSSSSLTRYSTSNSSGSANSDMKKKVYDINTSQYVYKETLLSPLERKVREYESAYEKLVQDYRYHDLNENLNRYYIEDGSLLFTRTNLDILRYTYFQNFTTNFDLIEEEIKQTNKNGAHKLKFMRKLQRIKELNDTMSTNKVGLPSFDNESANDINEIHTDEDSQPEDGMTELIETIKSMNAEDDSFSGIYDQYTEKRSHLTCVRSLIKSYQFWNNIYQDLKFDSIQLRSTINYFDLLPSINQSMKFFGEFIDYFFYNIMFLSVDMNNLSNIDREKIKHYNFFYYKDINYEYFKLMSSLHHRSYLRQSIISGNLNNLMTVISPDQMRFQLDSQKDDVMIRQKLMNKLIETIIENLKDSLYSERHYKNFDSLFNLWSNFFRYIIFEILINENCFENEKYSEPTVPDNKLPESNIDDNGFKSIPELSSTKSKILTTHNSRNESVSSKSINQSTMSSSRINYNSSLSSSLSMTIKQHVTNQSTDDVSSFTVASPSININLDNESITSSNNSSSSSNQLYNSKSKGKRKISIFGKFGKSK